MVDWDHTMFPALFNALLTVPNGTAETYFSIGADEYDTMFLLDYTGDSVRVTQLLDDGGYESMSAAQLGDVFSKYANMFYRVVSGASARFRLASSSPHAWAPSVLLVMLVMLLFLQPHLSTWF